MTAISYTVTIAGSAVTSTAITGGSIMYGRQRIMDVFTPATAYVQVLNPVTPWNVGDTVVITAAGVTRFDGRIVAMTTDQTVTTVQAVSEGLGYLAAQWCPTFTLDASPFNLYPYIGTALAVACMESEAMTYVQATIMVGTGAGALANGKTFTTDYTIAGVTPGPSLSGSYQFGGGSSCLDVCATIANNSSQPLLYEAPNSDVYFDAPSKRNSQTTSFALTTATTLRASQSEQNVNSLINRAIVTWTSGTKKIYDASSAATYGRRDYQTATQLTDVDDAALKASRIVGSASIPYWQTNPITVLVNGLSAGTTTSLLAAKAGTLVDTSALAADYPGMENQSYIEGWVERFDTKVTTFDLYLSPWSMTRKPEAWYEVTGTLAWNSAGIVGLQWLDLIRQDI